jgi:outer membrane protein assembly factor BamC
VTLSPTPRDPGTPRTHRSKTTRAAQLSLVAVAIGLSTGCALFDEEYEARVDYRKASASKKALDVPPDLSQIARDSRYQAPGAAVSASTFQAPGATGLPTAVTPGVAPSVGGNVRIERDGSRRWLSTPLSPEKIWPQVQEFLADQGLKVASEDATLGIMETEWAENRAKAPTGRIRNFLSAFSDSLNATGERDRYRVRIERVASGSEIYLSHKGLIETPTGPDRDTLIWENRPSDPELEAQMLQRLAVKIGGVNVVAVQPAAAPAAAAVAAATPAQAAAPRARLRSSDAGPTLEIDDGFDRAWRRLGLALDRSGFTVEDRDRGQGLYFVRYVDPALAGKEEPGFFASLLGRKDAVIGVSRYRVLVKSSGNTTTARVLNSAGQPETGEAAERILKLLLDEVK